MKSIFTIRGIAIACVVLGHAIGWVFLTQSWFIRDQPLASIDGPSALILTDSTTSLILNGVKQLTLFDVPAFLFASGFFLAVLGGQKGKVGQKTIASWMKTLLIPFIIWVAINVLASWLPIALFGDSPKPSLLTELDAILRFLYFVPLIFQFYLLSPIILELARSNWRLLMFIGGGLQLTNSLLWYLMHLGILRGDWVNSTLYYNSFFFWAWAIYFPLGTVIGLRFKDFQVWLKQHRGAIIIVSAVSAVVSLLEMVFISKDSGVIVATVNSFSSIAYAVSITLLLLSLGEKAIPYRNYWMNMGTRSLGIYLSHTVVLVTAARIFYHLVPRIVFLPYLLLLILFVLALLVPYILGNLLYRYARFSFYPYLFG